MLEKERIFNMIEIRNLEKSFGSIKALNGLNLTVKQGEIYGFIGRNGAGKSTTMNIMAGLSKPDHGTCIIHQKDVKKITHPSELKIGYLPENPSFQGWLTAYETLEFLTGQSTKKEKRENIISLLEWVGLGKAKNRRVGGFSRGMKQRLGMACALIHDPELLILDEPTSALDPEGRSDLLSLIIDLKNKGKTIILSTHILSDVERICDRIGLIHDGKLIIEKQLSELMNDHNKPIIDVEYEDNLPSIFYERISKMKGVFNIEAFRNKLSIFIDDRKDVKEIMRAITLLDIQITCIQLRKNTLEDLFIKEVNGK
ncbi:MAG TPA: ABC transporter ATP-binding protein [Acholeplasmataceae bacterium]|nr:ABC transporter ATP-binding protein [Acholeplasmataceae bacterium]HBO67207.1 ABC transporter ATP-binding protein [Acholeplasmataceae bacterium]HBS01185.1 ABC transporter ATP-binding protein [Acholeplasmataceae bacterium]HCB20377.1 ABC transporter ATP-binding protein [Acholeplasmataceae bacterium]